MNEPLSIPVYNWSFLTSMVTGCGKKSCSSAQSVETCTKLSRQRMLSSYLSHLAVETYSTIFEFYFILFISSVFLFYPSLQMNPSHSALPRRGKYNEYSFPPLVVYLPDCLSSRARSYSHPPWSCSHQIRSRSKASEKKGRNSRTKSKERVTQTEVRIDTSRRWAPSATTAAQQALLPANPRPFLQQQPPSKRKKKQRRKFPPSTSASFQSASSPFPCAIPLSANWLRWRLLRELASWRSAICETGNSQESGPFNPPLSRRALMDGRAVSGFEKVGAKPCYVAYERDEHAGVKVIAWYVLIHFCTAMPCYILLHVQVFDWEDGIQILSTGGGWVKPIL